jgi:glutathione S-transferase
VEELGVPYELTLLDTEKGEEAGKEFLEINPFGKVPALQDGDLKMYESAAICSYLAEKHERFIPLAKTHERALHDQWMYVAVTMIEPHTVRVFAADFFYKDEPEGPILREAALDALGDSLAVIEAHLQKNAYLTGSAFTVSDIMMTTALRPLAHTSVLASYPRITAYVAKNELRPAFLKAVVLQ